ncbi:MAG: hypothetical protein EA368_16700 [Leptolyngbya sp. DLM2.Bin27]|nr:MAG: hypothetical protein EA368_16700 [Leptolyngbya sp. DLM2.Bin27]
MYPPGEPSPQPPAQTDSGWEDVTFPGHLPLAALSEPEAELPPPGVLPEVSQVAKPAPAAEPAPENLVQLIQDLNHCNDALLLRVTELEEALERSQVALQAEIERTQASSMGLPVDRSPGPVQQQIAQLLSELDIANDGLRRTTIHNETLQTDLEVNRQRVAQLERECTLLQQRFGEKITAIQRAEATCRDLKARLHRQQRYTLQFKAALEKCLNMTPTSATATTSNLVQGQLLSSPLVPPPVDDAKQPVAMPRSQQIQPWSGGQASLVSNPSLTQLLRGLRGPGAVTPEPAPQPLLESQLQLAPQPQPAPVSPPDMAADWLTASVVEARPAEASPPAPEPFAADPWIEEHIEAPVAPAMLFTEPSPWGEPLVAESSAPEKSVPSSAAQAAPSPAPSPAPAPETTGPIQAAAPPSLPSYPMTDAQASPSPLVYPLRSQKKIKSIAAVELPSFGRTMRR